jgi:O-antigen chain-terminating methyltransferase
MLQKNNTDIDVAALNTKVQSIITDRRRTDPLLPSRGANAGSKSVFMPSLSSEHQLSAASLAAIGLIKNVPLLGTLAALAYRRARQLLTPGLNWKQRMSLIPVIGPFATWANSVVMIISIRQHIETEIIQLRHYEKAVKSTLEQMNARVVHFEALQIEQRLQAFEALQIEQRLQAFEALQMEQRLQAFEALQMEQRLQAFEALQIEQRLQAFDAVDIAQRLTRLDAFAKGASIGAATQDNRIASLTRELRSLNELGRLPPLADTGSVLMQPETKLQPLSRIATDSFYIDFEDAFRGTPEDITERLKIYLPYLDKFRGDTTAAVVDVGCGRGEWLALLDKQGVKAIGIDLNAAMVDTCLAQGLHAQCMDAVQYLSQQPPGSLAAVTGFHIIEHLPFDILLALFDAALKALRPDGLIIFETPNPENLAVGACNFYYDPTHLSPIVPTVAEFTARQRGFAKAEILRLHPYPDSHRLVEDSEIAKRLNNALYGPQDFAVLAWKTHET